MDQQRGKRPSSRAIPMGIEPEHEVRYFVPLVSCGPYRAPEAIMDADSDSPKAVMADDLFGDPMDIDSHGAPEAHGDRMDIDLERAPEAPLVVEPVQDVLRAPVSKPAAGSKRKHYGPFDTSSSEDETEDGEDVQVWVQLNKHQEPQTYVVTPTGSPKNGEDWTWCGIPGPAFLRMIEAQKQKKAQEVPPEARTSQKDASQTGPSRIRSPEPCSSGVLELCGPSKRPPVPERRTEDFKQDITPPGSKMKIVKIWPKNVGIRSAGVPLLRCDMGDGPKPKKTVKKPAPASDKWAAMCGPEEGLFVSSDEEESKKDELVHMGRYKMTREKPVKKSARK